MVTGSERAEHLAESRSRRKRQFFWKLALFGFALFCVIVNVTQQIQYNNMCRTEYEMEKNIRDTEDQISYVQARIAQPFDDEYVKNLARAKLGYHVPEEVLYYNDLIK